MNTTTAPAYEVRTIWEGELVASIDCVDEQDGWSTFRESTLDDDGYTIQLIEDDRIIAEQTNPDENGEI